ncbi:hypothetical protein IWZ03DRAFT_100379 [Phyllosticta citriasiana]|uniref:Uncharacterized protein n=1 Tax=Phyllosticta citriasiana TaxID=595635 RepID=A0ABR1KU80_9PEZI
MHVRTDQSEGLGGKSVYLHFIVILVSLFSLLLLLYYTHHSSRDSLVMSCRLGCGMHVGIFFLSKFMYIYAYLLWQSVSQAGRQASKRASNVLVVWKGGLAWFGLVCTVLYMYCTLLANVLA